MGAPEQEDNIQSQHSHFFADVSNQSAAVPADKELFGQS